MRIVFAGTPEVAVPTLEALHRSEHEVVAVVTREDAPLGRKRVLTPSPVALAAESFGLPVIKANRMTPEITEQVAGYSPELGVIVAYGGLVPAALLETPTHGWINLHFSLLPAWKGAAPVQQSLIAGETENGITLFRLVEALDAGAILRQRSIPFSETATAGDVLAQYAVDGTADVLEAVDSIANGSAVFVEQAGNGTYAKKLSNPDGRLDWTQPADAVYSRFRGVTPEPGAYTDINGQRVKILALSPAAQDSFSADDDALTAGNIVLRDGKVLVGTGTSPLQLKQVQPSGKKPMLPADWFRGQHHDQLRAE